jgi:VWFA-related protein
VACGEVSIRVGSSSTRAPAAATTMPASRRPATRSTPSSAPAAAVKTGIDGIRIAELVAVVKLRPSRKSVWLAKIPSMPSSASRGQSERPGTKRSCRQASKSNSGVAIATRVPANASGGSSASTSLPTTCSVEKRTWTTSSATRTGREASRTRGSYRQPCVRPPGNAGERARSCMLSATMRDTTRSRGARRGIAAALAGTLWTLPVPATQPLEEFAGTLDVVAVEIPVEVLRDGRPLRGLRRENFALFEEGERREITGFEAIDYAGSPAGQAGADVAPPPAERRNVLLLFDFLFASRVDRQRALLGARRFVEASLGPADHVAVGVSGAARGSRLIVPFTRDRSWLLDGLAFVNAMETGKRRELERAREALAGHSPAPGAGDRLARLASELGPAAALAASVRSGFLATDALESSFAKGRFDEGAGRDEPFGSLVPSDPVALAEELAAGAVASTAAEQLRGIAELMAVLRDLPGRKLLLFFSRGLDANLIRRHDSIHRAEILGELERTAAAARRSGWAMHPIDLAGVPSAERPGFDAEALFALASGTGGRLRENFNDFDEAAARVLAETEVTYVLTFQRPALAADGALRRIDVELVGAPAGARVVHRPGNQAALPARQRSALQRRLDRAAEILGESEVAELDVELAAFPWPSEEGRGRVSLALRVDDRWRDRAALPGAEVEFEVAAYLLDADLAIAGQLASRVRLDPTEHVARLTAGALNLLGEVEAPAGSYRLRVLVRDPATGRIALLGQPLALGAPAIWPPLVAVGNGVALALGPPRDARRDPRDPFAARGPVLVPFREIGASDAVELELAAAGLAPVLAQLAARVLDAAGRPVSPSPVGEPVSVAAPVGLRRWRACLDATGLAPGGYRLELVVGAAGAGERIERTVPFVVTAAAAAGSAVASDG